MDLFDVLFAKKLSGGGSPFPPVIKRVTGNPVEFTDGAAAPLVKCVTQITGSQDLHGYDKPWVGGAGVNLARPAEVKTYTNNGVTFESDGNGNIKITGTATGGDAICSFACDEYVIPDGSSHTVLFKNTQSSTEIQFSFVNNNMTIDTWSLTSINRAFFGYQAMSNKTVDEYKLLIISGTQVDCTISLMFVAGDVTNNQPVFTPYSNICPITAYTEGEIEVRGKNILSYDNIGINWDGTNIPKRIWASFEVPPGKYTFHTKTNSLMAEGKVGYGKYPVPMTQAQWDESGSRWTTDIKSGGSVTVTTSETYKYLLIGFISNSASITEAELEAIELQCEKGESFTSYEKPNHTTHTTTYPSAIYRGSEDCVNGTATKRWGVVVFDGSSDEYWVKYGSGSASDYAMRTTLDNFADKVISADDPTVIANMLETIGIDTTWGNYDSFISRVSASSDDIVCGIKTITSVADWRTYLSTHNLVVAYELQTPTEETVTPTNLPIKSLYGYNHIESSTGDMTIDYITDAYQNFVNTVESALPNTTRNLLTASKGGTKALDIFKTLDEPKRPEASAEESEPEEKETEEDAKR